MLRKQTRRAYGRGRLITAYLLGLAMLSTPILQVRADEQLDRQRTDTWLTDIPFYRSGRGTNVVPVQVGSTETRVNLTVSKWYC